MFFLSKEDNNTLFHHETYVSKNITYLIGGPLLERGYVSFSVKITIYIYITVTEKEVLEIINWIKTECLYYTHKN
jgi:hypothetical protein